MATAEFLVQWDNPADAQLTWKRDLIHNPRPSRPLVRSYGQKVISSGVERANETLSMPGRSRSLLINGYTFSTEIPDPPESAAQKDRLMLERMAQHVPALAERWRAEFEPELQRDLDRWRKFDLQAATDAQLAQHLEELITRSVRHWEIHFLVVFPLFDSTGTLATAYARLTGDPDEQAPYRLLAGFPTKTTERDEALWRLSETARQTPAVQEAFASHTSGELPSVLRGMGEAAGPFLHELGAYQLRYGDRGEASFDEPTWREDPSFLLTTVKAYLASARRHPREELQAVAAERERFVEQTLERIPERERPAFMQALRNAQGLYPLRENHAFYIDQSCTAHFRYAAIEIGRRLACQGVLAQAADVFYLELGELREAAHQPGPGDMKPLVATRAAGHARALQMDPPLWIGRPPEAPTANSEMAKYFREVDTTIPEGPITTLKGAGGSRGVARGPARIVLQPEEFERVQPGDVLVCPTTFPPWTPLFRVIAALVTDSGGVLSHGAIVAREYKLPAVVGTGTATHILRDGQWLEVNGTLGIVTLLNETPAGHGE